MRGQIFCRCRDDPIGTGYGFAEPNDVLTSPVPTAIPVMPWSSERILLRGVHPRLRINANRSLRTERVEERRKHFSKALLSRGDARWAASQGCRRERSDWH
jgi:hypothetical protein